MKNFKVTGRVAQFFSGRVKLSVEQAASRLHNLKDLGEGIFEIINPIEFKHGEKFGYDGDVPKVLAKELKVKKADSADGEPPKKKKTKKTPKSGSKADSGGKGAGSDEKAPETPKKLSATALNKLNKLVLFGMLPEGTELDFEEATKADFIKVILGD